MATVKAVLNKDREKKRGGFSLVIQIIHRRVRRVIYTPYVLRVEEFDKEKQRVLFVENSQYTHKQIREINKYIGQKKLEIEHLIKAIASRKESFVADDVIVEYHQKQSDKYLLVFFERAIEKKEKSEKAGTARALRATLYSLQKFIGSTPRVIKMSDVTSTFVRCYEAYLYDRGVIRNTVNFYMRNFRSIYNLALESGVEMIDNQPFEKIHIRSEKTKKRALKKESIEHIATIDLSDSEALDKARDLFMFSFYTRGMSFVDIVFLRHEDIIENTIYYKRRKTNQNMQVAIIPPLQEIINKNRSDDIYVLPFLNKIDQPTLYKKYQIAYGNLYRSLKILQNMLGLSTPLTMHVARHSWATLAKESGAPTATISQGLGHNSEKTTEIYLKDFDNSVIDAINAKVAHFFISK